MFSLEFKVDIKMDYCYSILSMTEKNIYNKIVSAIQKKENSVTVIGCFPIDSILRITKSISYDKPELFYVNLNRANIIHSGLSTIIQISYICNIFNIDSITVRMEQYIDNFIKEICILHKDTTVVKCKKIHNYMIRNIVYDYNAIQDKQNCPYAYTIEGVFGRKSAVCEGIAKAFKLICDRVGVESFVITGNSSLEGVGNNDGHAWNIVKIGDTYNHMDITWDMCISGQCKFNRYDYFLISDQNIKTDHRYDCIHKCDSMENSFFKKTGCLFKSKNEIEDCIRLVLHYKKKVIYFKYLNSVDENMEKKINRFIIDRVSTMGHTFSYTFINNVEQGVFFVKLRI